MNLLTYSRKGAEGLGKLLGLAGFGYATFGWMIVPPSVLLGGM